MSWARMRALLKIKLVTNKIIYPVLYNTVFTVWITETMRKLADSASTKCRLCNVEEASTTSDKAKLSIKGVLPRLTRPSSIPSNSNEKNDNSRSYRSSISQSQRRHDERMVSKRIYSISKCDFEKSFKRGSYHRHEWF